MWTYSFFSSVLPAPHITCSDYLIYSNANKNYIYANLFAQNQNIHLVLITLILFYFEDQVLKPVSLQALLCVIPLCFVLSPCVEIRYCTTDR